MEFKDYKFIDLVDSISDTAKINKDKVILINTSDVGNGKVWNHTYTDNSNLKGQFKKRFKEGDILYSEIRPKNRRFAFITFDSKDYIASTKLMVLRKNNKEINNNYLFYILSSDYIINKLQNLAELRSGTFPQITFTELSKLKVKIPSLDNQNIIVKILSSIDKKIELNNKINENLQKLSQELYKNWFIDFEFPNEEGKPYKSSGGKIIKSELGDIPEEWSTISLGKYCSIKYGKNLPNDKLFKHGYKVFGGNGIIGFNDKYMYKDSQVLISCRGAASGKTMFSHPYSFVTNNSLILEVEDRDKYFYLKEFSLLNEFYKFATGSAQPQITIENIKNLKIKKPTNGILLKFKVAIENNEKIYFQNNETNLYLENLRDELLPKLLNGDINLDGIAI